MSTRLARAATLGLVLVTGGVVTAQSTPGRVEGPESSASKQGETLALSGPGIVFVVNIFKSRDSIAAQQFELSCTNLWRTWAGVRHIVVESVEEASSLVPGQPRIDLQTPPDDRCLTLILDYQGQLIQAIDSPFTDAGAPERITSALAEARSLPSAKEYNLPDSRLAIKGYDPVSYFVENTARRGLKRLEASFAGVTYRFSSPANRDRFLTDPLRYLPTYGGWCASAMGDGGRKVEIDPTNFKVKDGRLFLFYKSLIADAKRDWNRNEKQWEPAADAFWKQISGEDPIKPNASKTSGEGPGTSGADR